MIRNRVNRKKSSRHSRLERAFGPLIDSLEQRIVFDTTVVFNEIMYNPGGTGETLEFVEFHNQLAVNMDISGWTLAGGVNFTFPEGTVVPGDGYLVVAANPAALQTATGY